MNKEEAQAVKRLRSENSDLLTAKYNTDFNLLRWAQGYGFDMEEASAQLRRHLKFRKFYDLDHSDQVPEHQILKQYFPIGLVGKTGMDNTLLVIECAGRIDLVGILKSVQLSDFLIQRFRLQEKMLGALNELEAKTGKQASVIYILDLDGLKFDTSLLSIVTGPYRILWESVYTNYPEWIKIFFIVNAPPFMGLIWKAIGPLLPERTRNKVQLCTTNSDWKNQIQKVAKPENIPAHWGGKLYDSNGDGMCRDRLNIPFDPIPHELYWEPDEKAPGLKDLTCAVIPAGKAKIVTYVVSTHEPTYIVVNRFCDRTFGMGIWFSEDPAAVDSALDNMIDWFPDFDYPGMPTVDYLRIKTLGAGVYKVKYGNEQAWVRSLTVYYRIQFEKENGELADFKELE
uniref:CRAL-TRIO domain-containing protein n=1 Tax=Haemonchus contortus TaxID=6289 RepID=A0A7I4Y735_HAECO|nr:Cellular retinaldehyde-binding triple function domain containing protein [Haemonchus contortus]